ncbi:hypothetical protein BpHYR1_001478 [Brachionus plicatilis]|uniref:Uncharacterized protein n=1 Tax=Brachionus plicatilis TaxID=10195 RepID=A0A3M7SVI4_BRAPC|nr:hypothetical protein BpHYR1_001478 [Brachionus plicatilis]
MLYQQLEFGRKLFEVVLMAIDGSRSVLQIYPTKLEFQDGTSGIQLEKSVSHQAVFKAIQAVLNQADIKQKTSLYNFSSNKVRKRNSGSKKQSLQNFFNVPRIEGLNIVEISEEIYRESAIKNGFKRVKISYPKEADNIIRGLTCATALYGLKCVVSIAVQKQSFYFCNDEGHNVAKCPVKDSICGNCQQKGLLTQNCSLAEKLKSLERQKIDYNDLYLNEDDYSEEQNERPAIVNLANILQLPDIQDNVTMSEYPLDSSTTSSNSLNISPNLIQIRSKLKSKNESHSVTLNHTNH